MRLNKKTKKDLNKCLLELAAKEIARSVVEGGGYCIVTENGYDAGDRKGLILCLLHKYGIEKVDYDKDILLFIPASFETKRKEKILKKVEELMKVKESECQIYEIKDFVDQRQS